MCEFLVNTAEVINDQTANCIFTVSYENNVDFGKIEAIDVSRDHVVKYCQVKEYTSRYLSNTRRVQLLNVAYSIQSLRYSRKFQSCLR